MIQLEILIFIWKEKKKKNKINLEKWIVSGHVVFSSDKCWIGRRRDTIVPIERGQNI